MANAGLGDSAVLRLVAIAVVITGNSFTAAVSLPPPLDFLPSCVGFCGGLSPAGCFCDPECTLLNDCCRDAFRECFQGPPAAPFPANPPLSPFPPLPPNPDGSCDGFCGGIAATLCFCDPPCTILNDCCPDYSSVCIDAPPSPPGPPPPPLPPPLPPILCADYCGGPSPFGCHCDSGCTLFDDCCKDAFEFCIEIPPSPPSPPSPPAPPPGPPSPPSPPVSCANFCGQQQPTAGCYCDKLCTFFEDCCEDAIETCISPPSAPPFLLGDVNLDGSISVLDVVALTSGVTGVVELTGLSLLAADVNQNGTIDVTDIVDLLSLITGV